MQLSFDKTEYRLYYQSNNWINAFCSTINFLVPKPKILEILENTELSDDATISLVKLVLDSEAYAKTIYSKTKNIYAVFYIYLFYSYIVRNYRKGDSSYFINVFMQLYVEYQVASKNIFKQKKTIKEKLIELNKFHALKTPPDIKNKSFIKKYRRYYDTMKNLLIIVDDQYDLKKKKLKLFNEELKDPEYLNKLNLIQQKIKLTESLTKEEHEDYIKYDNLKTAIFQLEKEIEGGQNMFEHVIEAKKSIASREYAKMINLLASYKAAAPIVADLKTKAVTTEFNKIVEELTESVADKSKFEMTVEKKLDDVTEDSIEEIYHYVVTDDLVIKDLPKPVNLRYQKIKAISDLYKITYNEAQEILNMPDYRQKLDLVKYSHEVLVGRFLDAKKLYDDARDLENFILTSERNFNYSPNSLFKTIDRRLMFIYQLQKHKSADYIVGKNNLFKYGNETYSYYLPETEEELSSFFLNFIEVHKTGNNTFPEYKYDSKPSGLNNEELADFLSHFLFFKNPSAGDLMVPERSDLVGLDELEEIEGDNKVEISKKLMEKTFIQKHLASYLRSIELEFSFYKDSILPKEEMDILINEVLYKKIETAIATRLEYPETRAFNLIQTDVKPFVDYGYFFMYNYEISSLVYDLEIKTAMNVLKYKNIADIVRDLLENKLKTFNLTIELLSDKNKQNLLNKLTKYFDDYIYSNFFAESKSDVQKMNAISKYTKMFDAMIYDLSYSENNDLCKLVFENLLSFFKTFGTFLYNSDTSSEKNSMNFLKNVLTYGILRRNDEGDDRALSDEAIYTHMFVPGAPQKFNFHVVVNYNPLAVILIFNILVNDDRYKQNIYDELTSYAKKEDLNPNYNLQDITTWHRNVFDLLALPNNAIVFKHLYSYIEISDFEVEFKKIIGDNQKFFNDVIGDYYIYNRFLVKSNDFLVNNMKFPGNVLNILHAFRLINIFITLLNNVSESAESKYSVNMIFRTLELIKDMILNSGASKKKIEYIKKENVSTIQKEELDRTVVKKPSEKTTKKKVHNYDELLNDFIETDYMARIINLSQKLDLDVEDVSAADVKNKKTLATIIEKQLTTTEKVEAFREKLEVHNFMYRETMNRGDIASALEKDVA